MLDEVNIVAERKKFQIKGGAVVANISGTPISKLSDIQHVLNVIPGIVSENETLKVLGKGEPLVYINNRKIRDLSEVFQLSPDNIKNIELITNPGAKYDSEVKVVLKINTIAPVGEGFSIDNNFSVGYQYKYYYSDNLKVNYRHNNFDIFASINYAPKKGNENVLSVDETFLNSYYKMFTDDYDYRYKKPFSSKIGMNYDFKSKNSIGFEYSNKLINNNINSNTATNLLENEISIENLIATNNGNKKNGYHLVNLYNSGSFLSWNYEIDFDAMFNFSDYDHFINEVSDKGKPIDLDCNERNDSKLYASKLELCKDVLSGEITIGTEHSFVNRNGIYEFKQKPDNNSNSRINERNSAIYSEFSQEYDNWSFTFGLRYEFVISNYYEFDIKQNDDCRKYHNIFPSGSFDFTLGEADLSISYDRSVQRPYYNQLGNNIGFINRYSYEMGNPLLKPAYSDDFGVYFVYKDFTIMADYIINHDYIYEAYTSYGGNEQISLLKHDNYNKFNGFQGTVAYNPTFSFYRPNLSMSIFLQDMSIVFCEQKKVFNDPMGLIKFENIFELPKQTTLSLDFKYFTPGDDELGWVDKNFSANFEVSKIFGDWTISIFCDDVFKTENHRFNFYGEIRKCTVEKLYDTRNIELSIRYKFNPAKSKYKGTGAGNDEKQRM